MYWASGYSTISFSVTTASIALQIRAGRCEAANGVFSPRVQEIIWHHLYGTTKIYVAPVQQLLAGEEDAVTQV